jgi:hypothetical protein
VLLIFGGWHLIVIKKFFFQSVYFD